MKQDSSFKFQGLTVTEELSWKIYTSVISNAQSAPLLLEETEEGKPDMVAAGEPLPLCNRESADIRDCVVYQ